MYLPSLFLLLNYPIPVSKWNVGCWWPLWRHCSRFRLKLPGEEYERLQPQYQISWPRTRMLRKHLMKHYQWVSLGLRDDLSQRSHWNCMPNASSFRSDVSFGYNPRISLYRFSSPVWSQYSDSLRAWRSGVCIPSRCKEFHFLKNRPDQLCGPSSLLFNGLWVSLK